MNQINIQYRYTWISLYMLVILFQGCNQKYRIIEQSEDYFSFGVIADCQYCNVESSGVRKYAQSDAKLEECVKHLNATELAYTIHLGDFIDRDWESFDVVNPIYQELNMPKYHVLGNHDFSVRDDKKHQVRQKLRMPAPYYQFKVGNWRFVVLNGNDISYHAYPKNSKKYRFADEYYSQKNIKSPKWNGAIGEKQMKWLERVLSKASKWNEQVAVFCHFPIYPENVHNLWNADIVVSILERYSCVKAYINGHNHKGNYGEKNGIHYLTLKGMVDTEQNAYAIVEMLSDKLIIHGFGREENRELSLDNK